MENRQHKYRWPWEINCTFLNDVRKGKLVNVNDNFQIYIHQNGQITEEQITEHIKNYTNH
jgi:hypothetical protein